MGDGFVVPETHKHNVFSLLIGKKEKKEREIELAKNEAANTQSSS